MSFIAKKMKMMRTETLERQLCSDERAADRGLVREKKVAGVRRAAGTVASRGFQRLILDL